MRLPIVTIVTALATAACGAVAQLATAPTPAPPPEGWHYQQWTEPALEVAVPSGWQITTDFGTEAPSMPPPAGPKEEAIRTAVGDIQRAGGYRANLGGPIDTPLGAGGPAYVDVFVEAGAWTSPAGYAERWRAVAAPLNHEDAGPLWLPAGEAVVIEVDDRLEGPANWLIRARWYLFVLPDGRGMNIAVGTYDEPEGLAPAASMETLRTFADRVMATLRSGGP